MRAPISVIIPTLNAAPALGDCVASLFEGLNAGMIYELILSDGGSDDDTADMAEGLGARLITGKPGRGGQLGRAADQAGAEWLLFLHADTRLLAGWSDRVLEHIATHPDQAACFRLSFDAPGLPARWVAGWANLRTRLFHLPYGDQGLLISRALYDRIGGYQDVPLMEDVLIARALWPNLRLLSSVAETSAAKYRKRGWSRQGARNLWTLARFLAGADPVKLARSYRR